MKYFVLFKLADVSIVTKKMQVEVKEDSVELIRYSVGYRLYVDPLVTGE